MEKLKKELLELTSKAIDDTRKIVEDDIKRIINHRIYYWSQRRLYCNDDKAIYYLHAFTSLRDQLFK